MVPESFTPWLSVPWLFANPAPGASKAVSVPPDVSRKACDVLLASVKSPAMSLFALMSCAVVPKKAAEPAPGASMEMN